MKKSLLILGSIAFILGGCNGQAGEEQEPVGDNNGGGNGAEEDNGGETTEAGDGMELYEDNCLSCHGGDFEGGAGPALDGYDSDEVMAAIEEGPGSMPADIVTGDDAEAVADYVEEEAG
ncbi:mono/diheme cytochrome c family protein [Geomicrobium halophilum]|uniref:Mono/diheme cytochrome c family protein n=1 Tax=Geomicrobium halophilum TaxID=549000 RepID=A0A841Q293_9BACL|nr:cytochrome c [Geomicrobium halophilum]MBB6450358.1 mono/diheme cytochrome c family protein [Geomicrobium halophilum]